VTAAGILWLAVPRLFATVISAPHGSLIEELDKPGASTNSARERAAIAYSRALEWHQDARESAGLGALYLAAAQGALAKGDRKLADENLDASIAYHKAALSQSPLQPYVWTRLVQAEIGRDADFALAAGHLRMAVATAPWEPPLVVARLGLAFVLWDQFDASTRDRLAEQIRYAARFFPTALARQARLHRAQEIVLQIVDRDADLLRRFSLAYSRI
jgi:hypothetical protein